MKQGFVKKNLILLFAVIFILTLVPLKNHSASAEGSYINISPVVQLVSYRSIYGKYVEMYGWGSASIISKDGVIISNNHVVDDGRGYLAAAFSVCITKNYKEKPSCDYTATLIDRDDTMDVSMLKIDPVDVHGNKVDYSQFRTIDIDFDYVPTNQDEVLIEGYPWVGADTITETKGIVSGVSDYNGYSYIKTDAVIAGGNSGGAMINKQGKLIGIPTFTIGGFFDASLGYGLSVKEAEEFIKLNLLKPVEQVKTYINFADYQKTIDNLNKNQIVKDDLVDMNFGNDYEVKNYINNKYVEIGSKTQKDISVSDLSIELLSTPLLKTDKQLFYYAQNQGYYYNDSYTKLVKKTIGGLTFYTPVWKDDVSGGNTNYSTTYFTKISDNLLLVINVIAPLYDEKNNTKVKAEVDRLLATINFSKDSIIKLEKGFVFDLPSPAIKILGNAYSEKNERIGSFTQYLNNLHEYYQISIYEKDIYSGKGKTAKEIYDVETESVNLDYKSMIKFLGHDGYIYCDSSSYYSSGSKDENGIDLPEMSSCSIKILDGIKDVDNKEYSIDIYLNVAKNSISKSLDSLFDFMNKNIEITPTGDGQTNLVNIYKNIITLKFNDLSDQTKDFKNTLSLLVKYNLIKNEARFNGNHPMTWREMLPIYLKAIYNIDIVSSAPSCIRPDVNVKCALENNSFEINGVTENWYKIISEMKIDLNSYISSNKFSYFTKLLHYKLAGIDVSKFTDKELNNFETNYTDDKYTSDWDKVKQFDNEIYGKTKISIYDTGVTQGSFNSDKEVTFNPINGIKTKNRFEEKPLTFAPDKYENFSGSSSKDESIKDYEDTIKMADDMATCLKSKSNKLSCIQLYLEKESATTKKYNTDWLTYAVLTKGDLYNYLIPMIDFGLFDSELAKKKDITIDEEDKNK